ncbi:cytochrome P450 [Micromonospora sp. B11E3]|uniref:cytochrome P450 n=1 Tax=Micromonospora sp. B11E3 TaxID=3153562 RepID=UPI00325E2A74
MTTSPSLLDTSHGATPPVAPHRLPGVGHLPALLRSPLDFMASLLPLGDVVTIYLGRRPVHVVNSLDLVDDILVARVENFTRGIIFDKAAKVLGQGLVVAEGDLHHRQRRLVQPALHRRRIAQYTDAMVAEAEVKTGAWVPGTAFDMNRQMHSLGLDMFTRALFSSELADTAASQVKEATWAFMAGIVAQSLYPATWFEKLPFPVNRRFNRARSQMTAAVDDIVSRYEARKGDGGDRMTILDMVMDVQDQMGPEQLRDEVVNLVVSGAEAPGTTLSWLFHELDQCPEVERRVYEEVCDKIGDAPLTFENLNTLEYTWSVVKETIRLHTPTWLLTRRAVQAADLGGYRIEAGADIAFSLTTLHRDSKHFDHGMRFDPARWLDGRTADLPRAAFMPFATGKHGCLGEHFAQHVILIAAVTIIRRWRMERAPGCRVREVPVALVQADGLSMLPIPR